MGAWKGWGDLAGAVTLLSVFGLCSVLTVGVCSGDLLRGNSVDVGHLYVMVYRRLLQGVPDLEGLRAGRGS